MFSDTNNEDLLSDEGLETSQTQRLCYSESLLLGSAINSDSHIPNMSVVDECTSDETLIGKVFFIF